jgi:hypothetical protein
VLPELGGERLPTRVFVSTYHDTRDLRLARHGVTFRHRVEDGTGLWQLKLPRGAARIELELPGLPARPPDARLLPASARKRSFGGADCRREGVRAQGAEIVDDSVSVIEGQRVSALRAGGRGSGDERTLRRLEKELRRAGQVAARGPSCTGRSPGKAGRAPIRRTPSVEALGIAFEGSTACRHDPTGGRSPRTCTSCGCAAAAAFLRCARALVGRTGPRSLRARLARRRARSARDLDVMLERLRAGGVARKQRRRVGVSNSSRQSARGRTAPSWSARAGATRCSTGSRQPCAAALGKRRPSRGSGTAR